jgi:hypothetical protein|nr:MAG: hypothetical protein [Bacteriophage sp.]
MIPEIDKDIIQMFYELVKNNWRSIYNTPECLKRPVLDLLDKDKKEKPE